MFAGVATTIKSGSEATAGDRKARRAFIKVQSGGSLGHRGLNSLAVGNSPAQLATTRNV